MASHHKDGNTPSPSRTRVPQKRLLSKLQDAVRDATVVIGAFDRVPFGPLFSGLSGPELADSLVLHRWVSKFEVPGNADPEKRKQETMASVVSYDNDGPDVFNWRTLSPDNRRYWIGSANWLRDTFRGFRPSYRFVPPSGESSEPGSGRVDVMFKLSDISFWEVSPSALPYVTSIIYNNQHLKSVVRRHFKAHCLERTGLEPDEFKRVMRNRYTGGSTVGYFVFSKMVMSLMTLSDISRMSTVPKNNQTDRPIDMVPFWNMVAQLSMMTDMRSHVLRTRGIDVASLAELHKSLIRHERYATIDLKNASNSVWMCVLEELWPKRVLTTLKALRTNYTKVGPEYHKYKMFGPMGCGLTFDVMTFTLHAFVQNFGFASVFGDDIICDAARADAVIAFLKDMKLQVNFDKTFTKGSFRESCGGFHDLTRGVDLVSFDFEYPENLHDAFTFVNKIGKIVEAKQCSKKLLSALEKLHDDLCALIPLDFSVMRGDVGCGSVIRTNPKARISKNKEWHRPIKLGRAVEIVKVEVNDDLLASEAAWMFAGRLYKPINKNREKQRIYTIDTETGVRLTPDLFAQPT